MPTLTSAGHFPAEDLACFERSIILSTAMLRHELSVFHVANRCVPDTDLPHCG